MLTIRTWNHPLASGATSSPSVEEEEEDSLKPQSSCRTRICFEVMGCRHIAWKN